MARKTLTTLAVGLLLCTATPAVSDPAEETERTNPNAGSIAPGSALSMTGTVVSFNKNEVVLDTTTGIEHVRFDNRTQRPATFTKGELITVDYTRTSQGVMIAKHVRHGGSFDEGEVETRVKYQTDGDSDLETPELKEETERTNPSAGSIAPGSGLTMTGTVVSYNEDEVVVSTTTGIEHIRFDNRTRRPASFTEGEMIGIDYVRTTQGVMIARQIRPEGPRGDVKVVSVTPIEPEPVPEPETVVEVEVVAETDPEELVGDEDFDVEIEPETTIVADFDDDNRFENELPQTASPLPLALLAGLSSLIAALGLRIARLRS